MRAALALAGVVALMTVTVAPAAAITDGSLDGDGHPYVGLMVAQLEDGTPLWRCSGTLISPTVFLTAGHCTFNIGNDGQHVASTGGNDVWVTFDDSEVLAGWPARADYPTTAALYAARSGWLNANAEYTKGVAHPNPEYDNFADFPDNHDVGVVVLDEPVAMATYGELAPRGTINDMAKLPQTRNDALIETVGYGIQSIQPHPMDVETRYKSTSRIVSLSGKASKDGNVHTLNNPSAVGGRGGSCFGDSGGPLLVNDTNKVVAVVSYGFSATCHGADYSWRVDTQPSYDFISPFLD